MNVRTIDFFSSLGLIAMLLGSVVADSRFPASAAEKAADQIIEQIWQTQPAQLEKPDQRS